MKSEVKFGGQAIWINHTKASNRSSTLQNGYSKIWFGVLALMSIQSESRKLPTQNKIRGITLQGMVRKTSRKILLVRRCAIYLHLMSKHGMRADCG